MSSSSLLSLPNSLKEPVQFYSGLSKALVKFGQVACLLSVDDENDKNDEIIWMYYTSQGKGIILEDDKQFKKTDLYSPINNSMVVDIATCLIENAQKAGFLIVVSDTNTIDVKASKDCTTTDLVGYAKMMGCWNLGFDNKIYSFGFRILSPPVELKSFLAMDFST